MPWNSTTKIMTLPININTGGDIEQATSCSSGDLGYCITNGRINKYAKYKPVEYASLGPTGRTYGGTYWRGDDGMCGLSIPAAFSLSDLLNLTSVEWGYVRPTTIFRHWDFDGYNGNDRDRTTIPTGYLVEEDTPTMTCGASEWPTFHVNLNPQDTTGYFLTASDLKVKSPSSSATVNMGDMHLGVILKSTDGLFMKTYVDNDHTLSDLLPSSSTANVVAFGANDTEWNTQMFGKTYKVIPFLQGYSASIGTIYCGLGRAASEILIRKATDVISAYIRATVTLSGNTITFPYAISNGYAVSKTVPLRWMVSVANDFGSLFEERNTTEYTDSKTLAALSSEDYTKTITQSGVSSSEWVGIYGQCDLSGSGNWSSIADLSSGEYMFYWHNGSPYTPE